VRQLDMNTHDSTRVSAQTVHLLLWQKRNGCD
jgi:hypothetical protein